MNQKNHLLKPLRLEQLIYDYPDRLVALEPSDQWRALLWKESPSGSPSYQSLQNSREVSQKEVFDCLQPQDLLLVNDTFVGRRRVVSECGLDFLFIEEKDNNQWTVLFPARSAKEGQTFLLPNKVSVTLVKKDLPQTVKVSHKLDKQYFEGFGELALPPYIQKLRKSRRTTDQDNSWYQTDWAKNYGSMAAPTASLHFSNQDLQNWKAKGVFVEPITLHVGLGTFLPLQKENILNQSLHSEWCYIPAQTVKKIEQTCASGQRVWALGTTVVRAVESMAKGKLYQNKDKSYLGQSDLFIQPGFEFSIINGLMTNFHQPKSSLLALVCAFAGRENVLKSYEQAIKNEFRLFSYGDLSIWIR